MKRVFILILIILVLFTGCSGLANREKAVESENNGAAAADSPSGDDQTAKDGNASIAGIKYFPTYNSEYKTARNDVMDFWFDIPSNWNVVDKLNDIGEYSIVTNNGKIDLAAYGILNTGSEEEFYNKLAGSNGTIDDFDYRDGWAGKKIEKPNSEVYYVRLDGDSFICFHVNYKSDRAWFEKNIDQINYVAMSFRTRQESFGKNDLSENKITLEDLKLGDVFIDMPYEKVKEVMKSELQEEVKDELTGLESKTLYFSDGTQIYIADGTVYTVNVTSSSYPTPRGLKVGDPKSRVVELYGKPDNINDETHWGYTIEGYELFTIVLKNGKVAEMQIDMVM